MSQYRFDPIRRIGVLYAPQRDDRPIRLGPASETAGGKPELEDRSVPETLVVDPFAPGCEAETPPEVYAIRPLESQPNDPEWRLRVIPNRYPFVARHPADDSSSGRTAVGGELADADLVAGFHEVVVESRQGTGDLADLSEREIGDVISAWFSRLAEFSKTPAIEWIGMFRNSGPLSGASLPHPHSQLVGLPFVPERIQRLHDARVAYWRSHGLCAVCEEAQTSGERLVWETSAFRVDCPRVSRFALEQRISPRSHQGDYLTLANDHDLRSELALVLGRQLRALRRLYPRLDYNLVLDTPPLRDRSHPAAHWTLEILPRTGGIAGFELVSGAWVNAVLPEVAAQKLRQAIGAG